MKKETQILTFKKKSQLYFSACFTLLLHIFSNIFFTICYFFYNDNKLKLHHPGLGQELALQKSGSNLGLDKFRGALTRFDSMPIKNGWQIFDAFKCSATPIPIELHSTSPKTVFRKKITQNQIHPKLMRMNFYRQKKRRRNNHKGQSIYIKTKKNYLTHFFHSERLRLREENETSKRNFFYSLCNQKNHFENEFQIDFLIMLTGLFCYIKDMLHPRLNGNKA